jgi:hypothetical protein
MARFDVERFVAESRERHVALKYRRAHSPPVNLLPEILSALGRNAKRAGQGYLCHAIWRGGDGFNVSLTPDALYGGGCKWFDFVTGEKGNGITLARKLGIAAAGDAFKPSLHERQAYAREREARERAEAEAAEAQAVAIQAAAVEYLSRCEPVHNDLDVTRWLESRGLTTDDAARAGLHAAPCADSTPYRLILPVYDSAGELVSYRRRWTSASSPAGPKEYGLKGCRAHHRGRVHACPLARWMLSGDADAVELVRANGIIIVEGGPDFITAVASWSDADDDAPAVLGIWTSSVSSIALWRERIPADAPVCIATDADKAGNKYAAEIAARLGSPGRLWCTPSTAGDLNDVYRQHGAGGVRALIAGGAP